MSEEVKKAADGAAAGKTLTIRQKLLEIQTRLHCPKSLTVKNYSGQRQYDYRNLAGIYESIKPLLKELKCALVVDCEPVVVGTGDGVTVEERDRNGTVIGSHIERGARVYQFATATLLDCESDATIISKACARENEWRKGMDASQLSGSAESFASKYACEHLFALDSTDDADDLTAKDTQGAATPAPKPAATAAKTVSVPPALRGLASEAWGLYKSLPLCQKQTAAERERGWGAAIKTTFGKDSAADLTEAEWKQFIARLTDLVESAKKGAK